LLNNFIEKDIYMYAEKRRVNAMAYLSLKGKVQYVLGLFLYDVVPNGKRWNDDNGKRYYRYAYKSIDTLKIQPKIYLITDGFSVSASSLVASYLKYYANAEVIGAESGGTYTGNNGRAYPEVQLPNSKIKIRLPLQYISYFPGVPDEGRGVKVDHYMSPMLDKKSQEEFIQSILLKIED
jgi:C-terminal processing protease CtpA/Prc